MWKSICVVYGWVILFALAANSDIPEYIKQCNKEDPQLIECFKGSLQHLKPYLAKGIPEIELPSVEPFKMDALALQLTGGPQGYKITLKNIDVYGASDFKVNSMKLSDNGKPFEAQIAMPKLRIEAVYTSSGVLLIIPASGHGEFHAVFDGVVADLTGKISSTQKPDGRYLHVDSLNIKLNIKKVQLNISKAFNNNRILTEATNLFLRDNGLLVVEAMQPQLQKKLASEFGKLANQLLKNVPVEKFYVE